MNNPEAAQQRRRRATFLTNKAINQDPGFLKLTFPLKINLLIFCDEFQKFHFSSKKILPY